MNNALNTIQQNKDIILVVVVLLLLFIVSVVLKRPRQGNQRMFRTKRRRDFVGPVVPIIIELVGRSYDEYIEQWVSRNANVDFRTFRDDTVMEWRTSYEKSIERAWFSKEKKKEIYENSITEIMSDDYPLYEFIFVRYLTRYRDNGYNRTFYTVTKRDRVIMKSTNDVLNILHGTKNTINGFEAGRNEYAG